MKVKKLASLAFLSFVASAFLFSGCGGSSEPSGGNSLSSSSSSAGGGGTEACTNPTLTLADVDWAAYQSSSNEWQVIGASNYQNGTILIPVGDDCKFSVAHVCAENDQVIVGHYNAQEITEGTLTCSVGSPEVTSYSVSGKVTGIDDAYGFSASMWLNSVSQTPIATAEIKTVRARDEDYNFVNSIPRGVHDLGAVELDAAGVYGFGIERDINISANRTGLDVAIAHNMTPYSYTVTGANGYTDVALVTENGTSIGKLGNRTNTTWYKPQGGLISSDLFEFRSYRQFDENNSVTVTEYKGSDAGDYNVDLTSITPLNVTSNNTIPLQINNLNYSHDDLLYYTAFINESGNNGMHWNIVIAQKWLGTQTSYLQPDFSALAGWQSAWNTFQNGDTVNWGVGVNIDNSVSLASKSRGLFYTYSQLINGLIRWYIYHYTSFLLLTME